MKLIHIIFYSISLSFIICCGKDNGSIPAYDKYYFLNKTQLAQTPYFKNSAYDTISFTSDKGDTLTFAKIKTDTSWYSERANTNPDDHSMNYYQIIYNNNFTQFIFIHF